jgi:Zn-dependent peptidase ImmA (M78 family)
VTKINHYRAPAKLLHEMGITEPEDIWLEAIAEHCDATIIYQPIEGAEARLLGYKDRAIITVNSKSSIGRQRFSGGHELGHWLLDRGQVSFSCTAKMFAGEWRENNPERRANLYATELLLPEFMFKPRAKNKPVTFAVVEELAGVFKMSLTATAIRLVEHGSFPAMIVCNELGNRKWFMRGPDVPKDLWPLEQPGRDSVAFGLLRGEAKVIGPVEVYADQWIDHPDSHRYGIVEDSAKLSGNLILSLLWWKNERQLLDLETDE